MPDADQALIRAAIDRISRQFDSRHLTLIEAKRDDDRPFWVLPVANRLLVFFEHGTEDHFRILDVLRAEQLDAWRDKPVHRARDGKQRDARA
ncbi:MAG: hypothetical protein EXR07_21800 [Acetobacteraceae bacterium]|nr:hypothetical protein [Acetobacteraceae bacterium]